MRIWTMCLMTSHKIGMPWESNLWPFSHKSNTPTITAPHCINKSASSTDPITLFRAGRRDVGGVTGLADRVNCTMVVPLSMSMLSRPWQSISQRLLPNLKFVPQLRLLRHSLLQPLPPAQLLMNYCTTWNGISTSEVQYSKHRKIFVRFS